MMSHILIQEEFQTPLGVVACGLNSSKPGALVIDILRYDHGESIVYDSNAHRIELITFQRRLPLYNGETVEGTIGWIWRITKQNDSNELLKLHCLLTPNSADVKLRGSDPGEHLDSALVHNQDWILHIGTEDGEVMHDRALIDDWMPSRLKNQLGFDDTFTEIERNGLITTIPELRQGEQIHFHYLVAYDKWSEVKVNTWLAVDEFKRKLENWIGVW